MPQQISRLQRFRYTNFIPKIRESILTIYYREMKVEIKVSELGAMSGRRSLLLLFYRQLKPLLRRLDTGEIRHRDEHPLNQFRLEERHLNLVQAPRVDTPEGRLGLRIRLRRTALGLTLAELGKLAQANPGHLSELERGRFRPRASLLKRIGAVLYFKNDSRDLLMFYEWAKTEEEPKLGKGVPENEVFQEPVNPQQVSQVPDISHLPWGEKAPVLETENTDWIKSKAKDWLKVDLKDS